MTQAGIAVLLPIDQSGVPAAPTGSFIEGSNNTKGAFVGHGIATVGTADIDIAVVIPGRDHKGVSDDR
jgi:hypothetical protein